MLKRKEPKIKGGAQKGREKKQKLLQEQAAQCKSLKKMFVTMQVVEDEASDKVTASCSSFEAAVTDSRPISNSDNVITAVCSSFGAEAAVTDITPIETIKELPLIDVEGEASDIKNKIMEIEKKDDFWFNPPVSENMVAFFKWHPYQPDISSFNSSKLYKRKDGTRRNWVTYSEIRNLFFCTTCLAYNRIPENSVFIKGFFDTKHMYQRLKEHEESKLHSVSVEAFIMASKCVDIKTLLFSNQLSIKQKEVQRKRAVLIRIIETIKLIGKRGLSYRATIESAYTLLDENVDHGNFLEILLLLCKFDPLLKNHIDDVVSKSSERHKKVGSSKGRGDLNTLLSKTMINYIIDSISELMKSQIAAEVKEAKFYSIQLDTTQDINVSDQCSLVIRYVTDKVHERLIGLFNCTSTTGKALCDQVCDVLKLHNLDVSNCIGNSTDGASNMQGQYQGFNAWLSKEGAAGEQIHVWCYAHVLNLVMTDVTKNNIFSVSLFGLLNACAVFFRESYLRMNQLKEKCTQTKYQYHSTISVIGQTRWWAKDRALVKIFGTFGDPSSAMFVDILVALQEMSQSDKFNAEIRYRSRSLIDNLIKFDTIVTAEMYLLIFQMTTPLSLYLQTEGMDVLQANRMVRDTLNGLKNMSRESENTINAAKRFSSWANDILEKRCQELLVEEKFPETRKRQKKCMPGELAKDEPFQNSEDKFKVEVYNLSFDTIINSFEHRFSSHDLLSADFACLHPSRFNDIRHKLPEGALSKVIVHLKKFNKSVSLEELRAELIDFARKWEKLKLTLDEEYVINFQTVHEEEEEWEIEKEETVEIKDQLKNKQDQMYCRVCRNCIVCCYNVLLCYNLYSEAYKNLFFAYKFVLTLSSSQVACERSFSKLKFILNRLRNSLSQPHLEALMIMSCEKDILLAIDNETIIDKIAQKSANLHKLLTL